MRFEDEPDPGLFDVEPPLGDGFDDFSEAEASPAESGPVKTGLKLPPIVRMHVEGDYWERRRTEYQAANGNGHLEPEPEIGDSVSRLVAYIRGEAPKPGTYEGEDLGKAWGIVNAMGDMSPKAKDRVRELQEPLLRIARSTAAMERQEDRGRRNS